MTETSADCPGENKDEQSLDSPEHWQNATPEQLVKLTKECIQRYDGFLPSWFMDYLVRGSTIWDNVAEVVAEEYGHPQQIQNSEVDGIQTGVFKSSTSKQGYFRLTRKQDIEQVLYPPVRGAFFGSSETMRPHQINKAWLRSIPHFLSIHPQLFCADSVYPLYHPDYTAQYISEEQLPGANIPCDVVVIMKEDSINQVLPVTRYWEGEAWDGVEYYFKELLSNYGVFLNNDHDSLLKRYRSSRTKIDNELKRLNYVFGVPFSTVVSCWRSHDCRCLSAMRFDEAVSLRHVEWLLRGEENDGCHKLLPEMELHWLTPSKNQGLPVLPRRVVVKDTINEEIHTIQIPYGMFPFLEYLCCHGEIDLATITPFQRPIISPYDEKQTFTLRQVTSQQGVEKINKLFREKGLPEPILYFHRGNKRKYCWNTPKNRAEYKKSHGEKTI